MGTAMAMHLARLGHNTTLWASKFDAAVLASLLQDRRHPALPEHVPESLRVVGPEALKEAAEGADLVVMAAHSGGARTLAQIVVRGCGSLPVVLGVAKGLEHGTAKRMSEVYSEEVGHDRVVSMAGPCLAPELALGLPTAAVFASATVPVAEGAAELFRSKSFHLVVTDDIVGAEYCAVLKNVAAIGIGILDGMGRGTAFDYQNAKAALFTQAVGDLTRLVIALGGRAETALGLAGLGDTLVTSLGGRNRLFGELLGEGVEPKSAVADLMARGMTVEGWDAAGFVMDLIDRSGVEVPFLLQMRRILFEGAPATSVLESLSRGERP
jgi:glycerol-3-phosphate dehydrogenase (NAD(P)+)